MVTKTPAFQYRSPRNQLLSSTTSRVFANLHDSIWEADSNETGAGATSVNLPTPVHEVGDLIVLMISLRTVGGQTPFTWPTDFVELANVHDLTSGTRPQLGIAAKVAGASEPPGGYDVTWTTGAYCVGAAGKFELPHPVDYFDVLTEDTGISSPVCTAPDATTTWTFTHVLRCFAVLDGGGNRFDPPYPDGIERILQEGTTAGAGCLLAVFQEEADAAGAVGSQDFTLLNTNKRYSTATLAVRTVWSEEGAPPSGFVPAWANKATFVAG